MSLTIAGLLYISLGSVEAVLETSIFSPHRRARKALKHLRWTLAIALGLAIVFEGFSHIDISPEGVDVVRSLILHCWRALEAAAATLNGIYGQLISWRR